MRALFERHHALPPRDLASRLLEDLGGFLRGAQATDDLSLLIVRRDA
jgi:serine phosphatase RsbU (regulator of sigma subunit)